MVVIIILCAEVAQNIWVWHFKHRGMGLSCVGVAFRCCYVEVFGELRCLELAESSLAASFPAFGAVCLSTENNIFRVSHRQKRKERERMTV